MTETRGRKKKITPSKEISVQVEIPLLTEIDRRLQDPLTEKIKYGARTQFINEALQEKLNKETKGGGLEQRRGYLLILNSMPIACILTATEPEKEEIKNKYLALIQEANPLISIQKSWKEIIVYLPKENKEKI